MDIRETGYEDERLRIFREVEKVKEYVRKDVVQKVGGKYQGVIPH
jgi:hypothetical protein